MTIALIAIPHQLPASIYWYADRLSLFSAAGERATDAEYPADFADAVEYLARDWHGHLLVETAADLAAVRTYTGHQEHTVAALVDVLRAEFLDFDALTGDDKRRLGRLVTRNSAGRHFTGTYTPDWLGDMEAAGWIWIDRPIDFQTLLPYGPEHWTVSVDEEVATWFDENGDLVE